LIAMDKSDIIGLSRRIGTEEFAASMPEYCGVISRKPTTRATLARVSGEEENFDFDKLEAAFQARRIVNISSVAAADAVEADLLVTAELPAGAEIIDIRHPDEEEGRPLQLTDCVVHRIPFFELNSRFAGLESGRQYLLFCDKGVMSQLHAAHLKDAGHDNVGVYRPAARAPSA